MQDFLDDLFEEVIAEEAISIFRESARSRIDELYQYVAIEDIVKDITNETIRKLEPSIVSNNCLSVAVILSVRSEKNVDFL
jgi:hypothetical protein